MMHLLERKTTGEFAFKVFAGKDPPDYAILSHTWHADNNEEVSYQDMEASNGSGKSKAGWKKINFCADKAKADGLRYFWIDTCCIDKKNAVELGEAINSMFRWYQGATKCYVFLSDVSTTKRKMPGDEDTHNTWEQYFRVSKWFTRGWTLQELIAPASVDFFSLEGTHLGDKSTLVTMIHAITGIARHALNGHPLSNFSVEERMSWAKRRSTKLEEDEIYSLLGIFDISMPLIYGEGRRKAWRRLQKELNEPLKGDLF